MVEKENKTFGLLGKNIEYSFSRGYFSKKFEKLNLQQYKYVNFDLQKIADFSSIIKKDSESIAGINVTIPYKQEVLQYLDLLDETAQEIGAVNTIKFQKNGQLKGYNSDVVGFEKSLLPLLEKHHNNALILGTGGASKAVAFALKKNNIKFKFVSRNSQGLDLLSYQDITKEIIEKYSIIINSTPVGTTPNVDKSPNIPYQFITEKHLLYDLIYNPEVTQFLSKGIANGAIIKNGYEMLQLQAEESWRIWNEE
ncbi:MAG: shikimate dehydrogenase [Polaribacter sp.]|nr:shikimate dehydrogenase [Polaribacter sp.]